VKRHLNLYIDITLHYITPTWVTMSIQRKGQKFLWKTASPFCHHLWQLTNSSDLDPLNSLLNLHMVPWAHRSQPPRHLNEFSQYFLHTMQPRPQILLSGPVNPRNCPFTWWISTSSNTWFIGPILVSPQTASVGFSRFCTVYLCDQHTDRHTDHTRYVRHLQQQAAFYALHACDAA